MAENPFGDTPTKAGVHNYLILLSASKDNMSLAQELVQNIKTRIDSNATPLWIDSKGIGLFVSTELVAYEIWKEATRSSGNTPLADIRDLLILEVGQDWAARKDAKAEHWLATHVGTPRLPTRRDVPRRN